MSAPAHISRENGKKGGRPKGTGHPLIRVTDFMTQKEIADFWKSLYERSKTDSRIALYYAEQMTGKAAQPLVGDPTRPISVSFDDAFTLKTKDDR